MTDRKNWRLGASACILRSYKNHTAEGFAQYKDGSGNIAKVNQCYNTGNITAKYNVAGKP